MSWVCPSICRSGSTYFSADAICAYLLYTQCVKTSKKLRPNCLVNIIYQ